MTMYLPTSKACLAIILVVITCSALTSCRRNSNAYGKSRPARSTSGEPEIVERPKGQDVNVGQQATFVCRVKSNLPVKITWMKQEMVLNDRPGSLLLANNSLIILHVQKSDGGIYKCIAKNNAGSSSAEATLKVLDPLIAPVITEISRSKTVEEGERVTFTCKANGNPLPRIKWEIENVADADPEQPSPGSIRILHATPKHSGYYMCIAVNEKGNDTRVIYLTVTGYPVFVESPVLNLTVVENTTISLNCKVIGSPVPDVTWYFHNTPAIQIKNAVVLSNKTLVISHVKFEDSGIYTCTANNSAGLRRSKSTLLRVLRKPRFPDNFNIMKNQTAIDGEPISLNCFAAGYPEPKYDWRFNNQTVSQSSVFTIPRVSKTSEGVYSCKAYNNLGALLVKILLSVLVPPKVSVKPERRLVLPGDSVEFLCSATGDPVPEIIWYLLQGRTWHNNSLVIANVSVNDGGEYTCEAKSRAGKKLAKGELVVAVRPTFKDVPRNITVNEVSSVSVSCTAKGPDQPVINWYRITTHGKLINISAGDKISTSSGTLKISHIVRDDGGLYSCEAKNYAGVTNTNFFINVQYPPYLIVPAQNVSIVAGKMAFIHCPVQSNPTAQIQWISPKRFDGPYLSIMNVDTSHGGQYVCRGFNSLGTLQATVDVTVLTSPRIIGLKKEEKQNNWISLTCETKGTPEPSVSWLDQTPLPTGSFTVHRGNLHLEKRFVDKMMFICNASNAYGWSSMHVKIPSSPYKFSVVKITSSSVTFSWLANSTEIIPHFVIERLSKDDSNWIVVNSLVSFSGFTVHDLQAFTWFLFRVSARNVLGTSEPSTTLNITTLEGVPSRPTNFAAESRELTSITVGWKPPKEPRGLLANVIYELFYMDHGSSPDLEMKIKINNSVEYRLKLSHLKNNSLYIMKLRAGRKANDGVVYWSHYVSIRIETLREAPPVSPKILKAVSNGPRRIFVSWERPTYYVDGYELQYKKYESVNVTALLIMSWKTTSCMITGLTANHYYEIQLRMYTSGGKGPWSVPIVLHTDQDKLALPGPLSSSSDGLPWKIALGASLLALVLLSLLLLYMYSVRRSKRTTDGSGKKEKKEFHKKNGYDFDNASRVSNESDGSVEGIYNVNMEDDIDLSMFDSGHHSGATGPASTMYVENPILPSDELESDDSYEAVRLATFTARPSPLPTPGGSPYFTGRRQISSSEMSSPQLYPDFPEPPDFAARVGSRNKSADNTSEQISDDILI